MLYNIIIYIVHLTNSLPYSVVYPVFTRTIYEVVRLRKRRVCGDHNALRYLISKSRP